MAEKKKSSKTTKNPRAKSPSTRGSKQTRALFTDYTLQIKFRGLFAVVRDTTNNALIIVLPDGRNEHKSKKDSHRFFPHTPQVRIPISALTQAGTAGHPRPDYSMPADDKNPAPTFVWVLDGDIISLDLNGNKPPKFNVQASFKRLPVMAEIYSDTGGVPIYKKLLKGKLSKVVVARLEINTGTVTG
jgi:hypothetical protein